METTTQKNNWLQAVFTNTCESVTKGITELVQDGPSHPNALARGLSLGIVIGLTATSALTPVGGLVLGAVITKWAYDLNRDGEELNNLREKIVCDNKIAQDAHDAQQNLRGEKQFQTTFWHGFAAMYTMANHMVSFDNPDGLVLSDCYIPEAMAAYYVVKRACEPLTEHTHATEIYKTQSRLNEQLASQESARASAATLTP